MVSLLSNKKLMKNIPKPRNKIIEITQLVPGKYQAREEFDQIALEELAETIRQLGILQPLLVRPTAKKDIFEIIAGERRWRAAGIAELKQVPCLAGDYTDEQAVQIGLIENLARKNLNPIEKAKGISQFIEEFHYTHEEASSALSIPRPNVTNLLRLLKLDIQVQAFIAQDELTEAHGKILSGLPKTKQYSYAHQAVIKNWSTRALEKAIKGSIKQEDDWLSEAKKSPDLQRLERHVSEYFGASIHIAWDGKQVGCLKIHFNSLDELEGIFQKAGYQDD